MNEQIENIKKMSVAERIMIIEDIWDSILSSNENLPISDEHKKELDVRLEDHRKNPNEGKSWEEVKKNVLSKL